MYARTGDSTASASDIPWGHLPSELVPSIKVELSSLAKEMIRAICAQIPAFTHALDEPYRRKIQTGVERALHEFVDRLTGARAPTQLSQEAAEDCRRLGRSEMRAGRSLEALQAAYRLGARLAWRRCVDIGHDKNIEPRLMYRLAEALFAFIDELAAYSAEGYSQAQANLAGETRLRRQRLLQMLTADFPAPRQAVIELAQAAAWRLPQTVQVVALSPPPQSRRSSVSTPTFQGVDVLADLSGTEPLLLVPEPSPQIRPLLERSLHGRVAAVGPPVPLEHAAVSLRWARWLLALGARGLFGKSPIMYCADNLMSLLLLQDEVLIRTLTARRLAPLIHLTPKQQKRITQTVLAWLQCNGSTLEAARMIKVHPQTVRYRFRQIEELFGPGLRDPDVRFELEVVLRAQELLTAMDGPRDRPAPSGQSSVPRNRRDQRSDGGSS